MSQSDLKEIAVQLAVGILSNPNYNFQNIKKFSADVINHAEALVAAFEAKYPAIPASAPAPEAPAPEAPAPEAPAPETVAA